MRNIFDKNFRLHPLTQGSIISNCIANEFPDAEVSGLIITPRCDLDHNIKVSTVHYLPVLPLRHWMETRGKDELKKEVQRSLKNKIEDLIKKRLKTKGGFMDTSMATRQTVEDILNTGKQISEKDNKALNIYFSPTDANIKAYLRDNAGLTKNLHSRLAGNQTSQYYLIEDWSIPGEYQLILLREVHQLTRDTAIKLSKGFFSSEVDDSFFRQNSLKLPGKGEEDAAYEILAELKSPFIEHVMQSYSYHFTRIGVEDREEIDLIDFL